MVENKGNVKVAQSCPTLSDPMEWVAVPFSRGSSQPRDRTQVYLIVDRFFTSWATREAFMTRVCIKHFLY